MVEKELKPVALKSKEYYRGITSIKFTPVEIKDFSDKLAYKKGDVRVKKRLFGKPRYITVTEDLYRSNGSLVNAKDFLYGHWSTHYNEEKKIFYYPAEVGICVHGKCEFHKFETNEEAELFIKDLRAKCAKCGNELL